MTLEVLEGGTWVAQSVKRPTFDFSSGHDLMVWEFEPRVGPRADGVAPTWGSVSPNLSALPPQNKLKKMLLKILERKVLDFTKQQWCAKCSAAHISILPHKHLDKCSDDEAEAQGDHFTIPRSHAAVEWQSINVDLDPS